MKRNHTILFAFILLFTTVLYLVFANRPWEQDDKAATTSQISTVFAQQKSGIQVSGQGVVVKLLADDTKGSRHQRFILRIEKELTVLVAHNIDLAPRVEKLAVGDVVTFYGVYEWNPKGGVIHWTHHDPKARHSNGWLSVKGKKYQ